MTRNKYNQFDPQLGSAEKLLSYFLKATLFLVNLFSINVFYVFYIFMAIVGLYGDPQYVHTFVFLYFTLFFCGSSFVLLFLSKHLPSRRYVYYLVGEQYFDKYFVQHFGGFLVSLLFLLAIFVPAAIEQYTYEQRLMLYNGVVQPLTEAYMIEFDSAGGVAKKVGNTVHIEKYVQTPRLADIYKTIQSLVCPCNGAIVDLVRKMGL